MIKHGNYSSKHSPIRKTSYHRVGQRIVSANKLNASHSDVPKVSVRKRSRKRKLLIQIAILGLFAWGVMLLLGYIVDNQFAKKSQNLSDSSKKTHILHLSSLHLLESTTDNNKLSIQADKALKTLELTQQLQNLRMHNILRTSHSLQVANVRDLDTSVFYSHALTTQNYSPANIQKKLIKEWEKDFINIAN